jgi:hypothetical protein
VECCAAPYCYTGRDRLPHSRVFRACDTTSARSLSWQCCSLTQFPPHLF